MDKKKRTGSQSSKKYLKNKSNVPNKNIRCPCNCEATKHPLVNNCLNCGRVVCLSEGPGPCFFCGNIVSYNNEPLSPLHLTKELDSKSKGFSENKNISDIKSIETLKLRDKLLEYDKDCASRTSVIDDECDYFQVNNTWLTKSQREQWEKLSSKTHEQKHKSRFQQKLSVDLTGRVYEEEDNPLELLDKINSIQADGKMDFNFPQSNCNPFQLMERAIYVGNTKLPSNVTQQENNLNINRIQDKTYLEILDQGLCLSMHQPHASLLVRGIKTTEERTWYSSHRGRLWIASTSQEPSVNDIELYEKTYQSYYNEEIKFPEKYPVGCLIGCVTVTDVLSDNEYNEQYPDKKTDSPFIFICENFIELPLKFPIKGKHKIYKLEKPVHRAALNILNKININVDKNVQ
jgi:hypothetical protein